jgi:hypothetical protein
MKAEDFIGFTDKEIRGLRNLLMDCYFDENKIQTLPAKISGFILKENPQGGNVTTRIHRCISGIDKSIIQRFLKIKD